MGQTIEDILQNSTIQVSCDLRAEVSFNNLTLDILKTSKTTLNDRQIKVLHKLLDGFDGKLTTIKWAKITKSSRDSALRDIQDLMEKGILEKDLAGGRSSNYFLKK